MHQKVYQAIILGALLHDIGKFWQRAGKSGSHQEAGAAFIDEFQHLFPSNHLDDLRNAIGNHHSFQSRNEIEKIVKIADWLASYELIAEPPEDDISNKTPLVPITSRIHFLHSPPKKKYLSGLKELQLQRDHIFPHEEVHISHADYHSVWTRFTGDLKKLPVMDDSVKFASLLSLLPNLNYLLSTSPRSDKKMPGIIRTKEKCPKCNKPFRHFERIGFICQEHQTIPQRFFIDLYFGKQIKIYSHKSGLVLSSYDLALETLKHIQYEIRNHSFDPSKYVKSELSQFQCDILIEKFLKFKGVIDKEGNLVRDDSDGSIVLHSYPHIEGPSPLTFATYALTSSWYAR
jgi:hypothetical protein